MHRDTPNRCLLRLREMRAIARERGGRCLSDEYVHRQVHMKFECRAGHVWETMPQSILGGSWCRTCAYVPADGMKTLRAIAREHGGRCLSREYVAEAPGMLWSCAEGHTWQAKPKTIRRGCWCPRCAQQQRRTLADMQELAAERGGKCVARSYLGHDTSIEWACAKGHRFKIRPRCVRAGQWCPVCSKPESSHDRALAFARRQGGALVTRTPAGTNDSVRWRCAEGHEWTSNAYRVARGAWCPWCTGRLPTIRDMQALAADRFGRCVSAEYVDQDTKLCWECERGHRWWTRPANVRAGSWCPECAYIDRAEQLRSDAKDRR